MPLMVPETPTPAMIAAAVQVLSVRTRRRIGRKILAKQLAVAMYGAAVHPAVIAAIRNAISSDAIPAPLTWAVCGEELHRAAYEAALAHVRPSREDAVGAVEAFLNEELGHVPNYTLIEDLDTGWAFYVLERDTTSYVHSNLGIEWYGTCYPDGEDDEEGEDDEGEDASDEPNDD